MYIDCVWIFLWSTPVSAPSKPPQPAAASTPPPAAGSALSEALSILNRYLRGN